MRYNNTTKRKDKNDKLYYSPSYVPSIPLRDSDIFVFVSDGTRFDMLAQRYYGDSNLWWIIAKANDMGKGKLGIDFTKKIRIPTEIDSILDSLI